MDDKGQMSAELILIMAAVLAISIFVINGLQSTTQSATSKLNKSSEVVLSKIDKILND